MNLKLTRFNNRILAKALLLSLLLMVCFSSFSQDRCGTVEYTNKLRNQKLLLESTEQFEDWLIKAKGKQGKKGNERLLTTYQIPVVVHIIHNGEPVGTGSNISDAQVLSQIAVLNRDYQRLNTDASSTPSEFLPVAGAFDIEFVLAKQNPEGLTTTGIVRQQGSQTEWSINDNYELKSLSYWPAEDYLNLWVCNIADYLGYAQFPVSDLPGLENASLNRLTDGVVVYYRSFGSVEDGDFDLESNYNKGRTATHEIAHFLGLRHIWGDDSQCGDSGDYVDDTPDQSSYSSGCPAHPRRTCNTNNMFQNYMDYTDDGCMNLFTADQVSRMTTVIENSVRRASLLTSHALSDPVSVANDAGIRSIISPLETECSTSVTPVVEIRNYGNNPVTSVSVRFRLDGTIIETKNETVDLDPLESTLVTFAPRSVIPGTSVFEFEILLTNGVTDGNTINDLKELSAVISEGVEAPFTEPFNTQPSSWTIKNPDLLIGWEHTLAPNASPSNTSMFINFYDYEDAGGETDLLISPGIDLSAVSIAVLTFDVAYSRFQSSNDGLQVYVLSNCNQNFYEGTLIYDKAGSSLATTDATNVAFVPDGQNDWRTETLNLQDFVGQQNIQLAFVSINDWGNNLYIDKIGVLTSQLEDIAVGVVSPGLITCDESPDFKVTVENVGTVTITDFDIAVTADGVNTVTTSFTDQNIPYGESAEVTLPAITLLSGSNSISIELLNPNGLPDINGSNNLKEFNLTVNTASERIPYRENFDQSFSDEWTILNPTNGVEWEIRNTNTFDQSIFFNGYDDEEMGNEAWLISPVLDFSDAAEGSLQFYTSYARRAARNEVLKVIYSEDCGNHFETTELFPEGNALENIESSEEWEPQVLDDWTHHVIDLTFLAGMDNLRFAFVVTNGNGNNLYLDNINFSTTNEPSPIVEGMLYAIYDKNDSYDFYITFNLPESQTIQYEVVDIIGRRLVSNEVSDVLNQTFPVSLAASTSNGIYIVRLGIGGQYYATKIYVAR